MIGQVWLTCWPDGVGGNVEAVLLVLEGVIPHPSVGNGKLRRALTLDCSSRALTTTRPGAVDWWSESWFGVGEMRLKGSRAERIA